MIQTALICLTSPGDPLHAEHYGQTVIPPAVALPQFIEDLEEKTGGKVKWIIPCTIKEENVNANPSA